MDHKEYEARKAAESARQQAKREQLERDAKARRDRRREIALSKKRFFCHPDKTVRYTGYLQLFTAVLAVATAALVAATVYSAFVLHSTDEKIGSQVKAMSQQLELMEADQRPWISAKTTFDGDISYEPEGLVVPFKFDIKNPGKSPAHHVFAQAMMFDHQMFSLGAFARTQGSLCDAASTVTRRADGRAGMDYTLFPGDTEVLADTPIFLREHIEKSRPKTGRFVIIPYLVVCVDYRDNSGQRHRSAFLYWITNDPVGGLNLDESPIQKNKAKLVPLGSYAD
jgi:hypothetical protein